VVVGRIYQSKAYPHIGRKVIHVHSGVVTYSVVDANKPDAPFRKAGQAALGDFLRVSEVSR
jgi:hypothetical protein